METASFVAPKNVKVNTCFSAYRNQKGNTGIVETT